MEREIKLPSMDAEIVRKEIGSFVVNTCLELGKSGCVIGLSGGVDSTTSAAIINSSFHEYNAAGNKLARRDIGLYIHKFDQPKFIDVEAVVEDYFLRHDAALKKAKLISPAIAPVTLQY